MDRRTQSREVYIMNEMIGKWHRLEDWLDENHKGQYRIAGLFLQGSQNYTLDFFDDAGENTSDVDAKAYVIPCLDALISGRRMLSGTIRFDDGSQIEVKDIRTLPGLLKSGAMNYMEMFFTHWSLIDHGIPHIQELMDMSERISRINPRASMKYMLGVAENQFRRLSSDACPKALYRIYHMRWLMDDFFIGTDMDFSLAMPGYSREGHQQVESMRRFHPDDESGRKKEIAMAQEALDYMHCIADRIEDGLPGLDMSVYSDLQSVVHDMVRDSVISDITHSEK